MRYVLAGAILAAVAALAPDIVPAVHARSLSGHTGSGRSVSTAAGRFRGSHIHAGRRHSAHRFGRGLDLLEDPDAFIDDEVELVEYREAYIGRGLVYNTPPDPFLVQRPDVIRARY